MNKSGRVAFMGGSITQMDGYRSMVSNFLKAKFTGTKFEFINAGISSTCSTTGAFRLKEHVLDRGQVDLFFVEFAVNDDQDAAHAKRECVRGMEGIIRHARLAQPKMDIIVTYFVNPRMLDQLKAGKVPMPIAAHEEVLKHYNISSIFLAREVADQIISGRLTWAKFGGTHPKPAGNSIASEMIQNLLERSWRANNSLAKSDHKIPEKLIDSGSYYRGDFLSPMSASNASWSWSVPEWKNISGGFRNTFSGMKLLCCETPDEETVVKFSGSALGAYLLAGPDAGVIEVSVDGGAWKSHDLYHRYSRGLHYPRTVMFAADLKSSDHTARIRMSKKSNKASKGSSARILYFTVNR
ncbi:SGNH/GDSL hydrolase family protein [Verrucomicrobia bacterium]|nr:SGNH/GDSL hydrolase family protein [Verrucomicrobiota bacterium]